MTSLDLDAALRRLKPDKRRHLPRRPDGELLFGSAHTVVASARLLLDTCVYLDLTAARLPADVKELLAGRMVCHATVGVAELANGLGQLSPADPRSLANGQAIRRILDDIATNERLFAPDPQGWLIAGLLSGIVVRIQSYGRERQRKALLDCLLYVTALQHGLVLLTANLAEFDPIQQLLPQGRVAFYRPV